MNCDKKILVIEASMSETVFILLIQEVLTDNREGYALFDMISPHSFDLET